MKNLSNMFLTECWRLDTSSRLFCDFIRKTIQQDLGIFNGWHIPFLIVLYSLFQNNETLESWYIWLLSNCGRLLIKKGLESSLSPPNCSKDYWKLLSLQYLSPGQVWWLYNLWFKRYIQKCTLSHVLILIVTSLIW